MRFLRLLLAPLLGFGLVFAGCSHAAKVRKPHGPGIGGTVIYITNTVLPENASIEVRLVELNREGSVDRVVAHETYPRPAAMPLEFWLHYQAGLIVKRSAYAVDAQIVANGQRLFATQRPIPVLTRGNPDREVEIVVVPVKN